MVIVLSGIITDYGYIISFFFFSLRRKKFQAYSKYFENGNILKWKIITFSLKAPILLLKASPRSVSSPYHHHNHHQQKLDTSFMLKVLQEFSYF